MAYFIFTVNQYTLTTMEIRAITSSYFASAWVVIGKPWNSAMLWIFIYSGAG